MEAHDGASKGKYTIGLGQDCLAFCTELEDVISMRFVLIVCLRIYMCVLLQRLIDLFLSFNAVTSLLEKYKVDPNQIGRLEVGSETVIDKSKSIKTFLMQLFEVLYYTFLQPLVSLCQETVKRLFVCLFVYWK